VDVVATSCFPFLSSSLLSLLRFFSSAIVSSPVVVVVVDDWRFRTACAAVTASIALSTLPLALRNASLASSRESHGHAANKAEEVALKNNPHLFWREE
jgi:hypothetical protein